MNLIAIKEITDIFHNYKAIIVDADGLNDENNKILLLYKKIHYELVYIELFFKTYKRYLIVDFIPIKNTISCVIYKEEDKHIMTRYKRMGKKEVFFVLNV